MLRNFKNRIFKKRIAGFFVAILFVGVFAPVALQTSGSGVFEIHPAVAHALVGTFIGNIILEIASLITGIGGFLLEKAIEITVLHAAEYLGSGTSLGTAIEGGWGVIRDISNLIFIFGFIYVGIMTIIDPEKASTKRFLSSIIIGALLINFSLFFTRIIVDVSNFVSIEITNTMLTGGGSITDKIMDTLGLTTLYKMDAAGISTLTGGGTLAFYFMGAIFLIVAGFVLASGAILLITRFVAIVFIMIFSPLLFAATVFPQTANIANDLWKKLFNYAFFAPAYLLLLIVSIQVVDGLMTNITGASGSEKFNLAKAITGDAKIIIVYFVIAIMFLIFSLQVAQKFGVKGADKVVGMAKVGMGAATVGMAARAGRMTAGRLAHSWSESERLKDSAAQGGLRGFAARRILKGSRVVGDSSFDARATGAGKALGIGESRKGGYKSVTDEIKKKEADFAKSLGEVDDSDTRVGAYKSKMDGAEDNIKRLKREREKLGDSPDEKVRKREIAAEIAEQEDSQKDNRLLYQQEKNRRILGSTYTPEQNKEAIKSAKKAAKEQRDAIKAAWNQYHEDDKISGRTDEERKIARAAISQAQDKLAELEKQHKYLKSQASSHEGYANVLEHGNSFSINGETYTIPVAWLSGRNVKQEVVAGSDIRKAYEKKTKASKEETQHKELVEKISTINKS